MKCPRCKSKREVVSEYYDFGKECMVRDEYCTYCKSVEIFKFYSDSRTKSEWIDLNE